MSVEERRLNPEADLSRRMDTQDALLREIRDMVVSHIAEEKTQKKVDAIAAKSLDEIVLLWRASKILVPALMVLATAVWGAYVWAKEHLR